jgi:hypothetical protein
VVVTVTVAVIAPAPFGVNMPGVTVQLAACGAPWHVTVTAWLNPPVGVTLTVKFAGCPPVVLTEFVDVVIEKFPALAAEAVPVRLTICGLPEALSVMLTVPVRVPVAVGLNVTLITQFPAAAKELPHVLVWANSPLAEMPAIDKTPLPLLERVTVCGRLVVPTVWLLKLKLVGES